MDKSKPLEGKENSRLRSSDTHESEKNAAWLDRDKADLAAKQAKEWVDDESRL
jgi:hypothetical protein